MQEELNTQGPADEPLSGGNIVIVNTKGAEVKQSASQRRFWAQQQQ